jgi:hypothetical protein
MHECPSVPTALDVAAQHLIIVEIGVAVSQNLIENVQLRGSPRFARRNVSVQKAQTTQSAASAIWRGGMSSSAVRITLASMLFSMRTNVEIAKEITRRLAAIPNRFQPIHLLKPRPIALNSPCIRSPGGASARRLAS